MGGAAPTPTGKGGKKALDAALNLVPFIDLLSCCISFLLITAVPALLAFAILNGWTQGILDDINEVSVQVVNLVVGHRNAMKGSQAA